MVGERVFLTGHIINSGTLSRVLDDILAADGDYILEKLDVGRGADDESFARILVSHRDPNQLANLLGHLQQFGANFVEESNATIVAAPADGVLPEGFYATTNLPTEVRLDGHWFPVAQPEMDCAIAVDANSARTCPMADVVAGESIVVGPVGVRVQYPQRDAVTDEATMFEFMNSVVSSEKPQALQVRRIAQGMKQARAAGQKILWVGGPALVHTGAAPAMAALIRHGWCDVLFAGNALAAHDVESAMYGTSLGVDLTKGSGVEHGHEHHLRAINRIRACGSLSAAVEQGILTKGIMHALVEADAQVVLVGSVRDDGPLPDVITDVVEGQRAMRAALADVGYAIMVATMLHSIATGNLMPAHIPLVCVDINPATVTKLADRGSAQATGVVTDIGLFCEQLARELL